MLHAKMENESKKFTGILNFFSTILVDVHSIYFFPRYRI